MTTATQTTPLPKALPQRTQVRAVLTWVALGCALAALAIVHLGQGNANVNSMAALQWLSGNASTNDSLIMTSTRLPRTLAAIMVGVSLGLSGMALQGLTRNPLASPDTLAVNSGAHFMVALATIFGLGTGSITGGMLAFVGGLAGAGLSLAVTRAGQGITGLILAGTVISLALSSVTSALTLLYSNLAQGLYAWGSGTLAVAGMEPILQLLPGTAVAAMLLLAYSRKLDLLQLGDDEARSLGERVWLIKLVIIVLSVALASGSVAIAGPIGFVGLCAPALARLVLGQRTRHLNLMLGSAVIGVSLVLGSDVGLRAALGTIDSLIVPTGVVTGLLGAIFLVVLSAGLKAGTTENTPAGVTGAPVWLRQHALLCSLAAATLVLLAAIAGMLFGDGLLLFGDLMNWWRGAAQTGIAFVFDTRLPRVLAALIAGACLALAGTLTQAATRNPLADPGLLGVSAGAGTGAMVALVLVPASEFTGIAIGATVGAITAAALVFVISWRTGFEPTRLILVGIGVAAGAASLTTVLVVSTNPYNQALALTWLGGSTYGAALPRLTLAMAVLVLVTICTVPLTSRLDLLQLDADTPALLGMNVGRLRIIVLSLAIAATTAATTGVGVIGFIGLVAPHLARSIVGPLHHRLIPLAMLLGALLVCLADTFGRTIIAPAQLPVGLVCAVIGAPIFMLLLRRQKGTS